MESARDGLMRREAHPGTEGLPAMRSDRFPPDEGEHCRGTARDGSADATILPGNEKKSSRARRRLDRSSSGLRAGIPFDVVRLV